MQGYKLDQIMNPFFDMPETYEETVKVYRTLAKAADQRLVRLESYEHDPNFRDVTRYSYARAMRDIQQWSGEQANRFNTAPPKSKAALEAKIEDIKTFLAAPTSTKKGIKEIYQKRANSLNEKYGTNFKWNDVGTFFESELAQKMDSDYASKTMMKIVASLQKNKKEILKEMEASKNKDQRVPDEMVEKLVRDVLENYGDEVRDYLEAT
ncbi:MAG: hypothetical protein IKW21_03975 [Lachnospiraceae bacterium]|nr:hypothetical protein [Lachnospiraceae bacterium]